MGKVRSAYSVLVGKPEGKRPLGSCRWEDNIRIDLREGVDWVHLTWDKNQCQALVNMVMNLQVP
jgi:hypothetical protein